MVTELGMHNVKQFQTTVKKSSLEVTNGRHAVEIYFFHVNEGGNGMAAVAHLETC